jgi:hypothetical protein
MDNGLVRLRTEVREQRAEMEQLEARLARVEEGRSVPAKASLSGGDGGEELVAAEATTGRRHLLASAAKVAAGAVVGGTALALGQATPAAAATGEFTGNPAVRATSTDLTGVAILASSTGISPNEAVHATTEQGTALVVNTDSIWGTHLRFTGAASPPPAFGGLTDVKGSMIVDSNDDLWFCAGTGFPSRQRRLAGPSTAGALALLPTPVRVYDSRPGQAPTNIGPKAPLLPLTARTLNLTTGVPAGATAALVNLVATRTTSAIGGFMTIYRNGISFPNTSNLNWSGPNQSVAVTTITALDEYGQCALYAGSVTDVVVDVLGYYR